MSEEILVSSQEPLLSVNHLKIGYRGAGVGLPPLSFRLLSTQITSIVGHNGSGKSTLLKTLLGLIPKLEGDIGFSKLSRIGYVPQREAMDPIYPVLVKDLVETGRYGIRGLGKRLTSEDQEKVFSSMEATGIRQFSGRLFRTLSGGEQQRTLLARALCTDPNILVLDEPTASMDEKGANETMEMTLDLAKKHGASILMVSHSIDLVAQVSDQVIFLDLDHKIVKIGSPKEILKGRGGAIL